MVGMTPIPTMLNAIIVVLATCDFIGKMAYQKPLNVKTVVGMNMTKNNLKCLNA